MSTYTHHDEEIKVCLKLRLLSTLPDTKYSKAAETKYRILHCVII